MTIGKKLYLGFGAILAIMLALFVINIFTVRREYNARSTVASTLSDVKSIESVRFQMMENRLYLGNYLLSGDLRDEEKTNKGVSDLSQILKEAESKVSDANLKAAFVQVEEGERSWAEDFAKPMVTKRHQVDAGDATVSDLQIYYLQHDPNSWFNKSSVVLDEANLAVRKALDDSNSSATSATSLSTIITTVGTFLAILLGGFIAFATAKSIKEPLYHLIEVAHRIGETGDLDQSIDIHRDDEVGILASNFNKMIVHLKEMAAVSAAIAEGQLSVSVQPRSPQDTMAVAFTRMTHGLRDLVRQVRDSASQVASGSGQMASASDESAKVSVQAASAIDEVTSTMHEMSINVQNVVKNTQVQASSVAETSASIDEMVTSIQRVADTAKLLVDISHRSREEVQTGMVTMDKATEGLNRTSHAIQSSAEIIDVLGRRADDIGKIIEVIDDLAEQTNLLALNAAIEAARAGEHGLGFAVVAEEVRKLAEKSTQSTKEISELIQGIQKEAREAVDNMEKSTSMVQEGLLLNKDLSFALEKISDVVSEVYKFSQEIGAATTEQSSGSTQIAKATNRLTEITQEINSSVEEQASGAQGVVRAMEKMRELVQQSTSSSTELAAAAEQMSKLSRALLESMDRFVLDEGFADRRHISRRPSLGSERLAHQEYAEVTR
ncbi:MAG TPA: methyl-accepting chemotaxis protein [Candidatus Acidoferrales bacterium]|jgi:methyl-accepting chemotaxis protein|nr:methyl-accepting chemotaxis protein [Candidatus Acidoferrales bacterium]